MKLMSENPDTNVMERHGCIVCGRIYNMLVVYNREGRLVDCTVTSPGGQRVDDADRPLVACTQHPPDVIKTALVKHYPGKTIEDIEDA